MKWSQVLKLVAAVAICESAGLIGSLFTTSEIPTWYRELVKPALNPPSWVFGPVWTTLFFLMGIAAYLVWRQGLQKPRVRLALGIFTGQLVLNVVWSILFFGLHRPDLAFIEITLLWLAILITMIAFFKLSKPAAWLLLPYLLWVSFASYLNFAIWQLNA